VRAGRFVGIAALVVAGVTSAWAAPTLTASDVERIIGQAVAEANVVGLPVNVVVVDHEGNVLGTHEMPGAREFTRLGAKGKVGQGAEGLCVPAEPADPHDMTPPQNPFDPALCPPPTLLFNGAMVAAISKAGTAAFFSTQGNAFSTRTAGFIVQQHFPPGIRNTSSGPLFGVQFSQLFCGDVIPRPGIVYPAPLPPLFEGTLPLGLSADPGGVPLYKHGRAVGGVGVEGDGHYTADTNPTDHDVPPEERIAIAATRGFETPGQIRGDKILVGGLRFPFENLETIPDDGKAAVVFDPATDVTPIDTPASRFKIATVGGVHGTIDPRYFPPRDALDPPPADGGLTAADVLRILAQGAQQANRTRAGIRRPIGDRARVNIAVVDRAGNLLGLFRTKDAPVFGFDVSVQKGRTAAFFSGANAATKLRMAGQGAFVDAAARDGLALDGSVAVSDRANGFLSRPFFPDGIDGTTHGPFSRPIDAFSVFNDGLQVELVAGALGALVTTGPFLPSGAVLPCTGIAGLENGIQIFPGSVPLYRHGKLIGGIGISGDGVDQDDIVAFMGARGFEAPRGIRADRLRVRGVRLPYVKFPRRPTTR
jgi:uncharacterized protein GlcG (DUF336 family)